MGFLHFPKKIWVLAARLVARNFTRALGYAKRPLSVALAFAGAPFRILKLSHLKVTAGSHLCKIGAKIRGGRLSLGVGYTVGFSEKVIRFSLFIFFWFTTHILSTNPKKVVQNINFKNSPPTFPVWRGLRAYYPPLFRADRYQNSRTARAGFWIDISTKLFQIWVQCIK